MEESQFISLFIPILMFYLFFAFPDAFLDISLTLYGRLISVLLIMYYTCIDKYYGILVCLFVIFYYQMDSIEGMCKYNNNEMLTSVFIEPTLPKDNYVRMNKKEPRKIVNNKKKSILLEDENLKIVDMTCCPVSGVCKASIVEKIDTEEDLVYPKKDENWAYQVWSQWFVLDKDNEHGLGKSTPSFSFLSI
tara:strand:+ start:353 stop:925 length:573 start_codon:yes stop_codon:yes gene_type:complete